MGREPETARREANALLGRVAHGGNPTQERQLDHQAVTVKELCNRYLADLHKGLILGKGDRPKKASTMTSRYIHSVYTALVMAADNIAGYIQDILDGAALKHTTYALDRDSRKDVAGAFPRQGAGLRR